MDVLSYSWWWFIAIGVIAVCIGSFLTVVIHRLPKILERQWQIECKDFLASNPHTIADTGLSLYLPPSHCPHCKEILKWRHNIPLLSFIFLKGRCAYCHAPIKPYFLIELTTLILWLLVFHTYGITLQFIAAATACTFLIALSYIDQREKILPDELTLTMLWTGLIFNSFNLLTDITSAVFGAALGYIIFLLVKQAFKLGSGKDGLGQGDLKLLSAIGAWLGWQALPGVILIASLSGIFISLTLIGLKRHRYKEEIAFGPYLAFAGIVGLLCADMITNPLTFLPGIR